MSTLEFILKASHKYKLCQRWAKSHEFKFLFRVFKYFF